MITGDRRCAACGYFEEYHDLGTLRCPKETADVNGRRGRFREDVPQPRRDWHGLLKLLSPEELKAAAPATRAETTIAAGPPQVSARAPAGPAELAGGNGAKQATKLGRQAASLGWSVRALYWRSFDGTEGCGVWLSRSELRALATWRRPAGNVGNLTGWGTDLVYAWRTDAGCFPTSMTLTDLEGLIT